MILMNIGILILWGNSVPTLINIERTPPQINYQQINSNLPKKYGDLQFKDDNGGIIYTIESRDIEWKKKEWGMDGHMQYSSVGGEQ